MRNNNDPGWTLIWNIMIMLGFVYFCVMFDSSGKEEVWSNPQDEFRFVAYVAAIGGISVGRYAWMEKLRCGVSIWSLSLDLSGRALDELLDTPDGYA
jgi:hypothetical protein